MRNVLIAMLLVGGLLVGCAPKKAATGAELYGDYCASCHGASGKGDGPAASGLPLRPADLTTISARNGGRFPMADVLSTIDGYKSADDGGRVMPEFGTRTGRDVRYR